MQPHTGSPPLAGISPLIVICFSLWHHLMAPVSPCYSYANSLFWLIVLCTSDTYNIHSGFSAVSAWTLELKIKSLPASFLCLISLHFCQPSSTLLCQGAAEEAPPCTYSCISREAFKDNCCSLGRTVTRAGESALILLFLCTSGVWSIWGCAKKLLT